MGQTAEPDRFDPPADLVAEYLRRFAVAVGAMAPGPRHRAVGRVRRLLHDDLLRAGASDADARSYLQELGTPEELADKAVTAQGRRGASYQLGIVAIVLTPLFWPLGLPLLCYSRYWTRTEKLIAGLVVPGGVPAAFYLWPALLRVSVGTVFAEAAETVLPLAAAAVAFYLVFTFVLRVDDEALGTGLPRKPR